MARKSHTRQPGKLEKLFDSLFLVAKKSLFSSYLYYYQKCEKEVEAEREGLIFI
jgi:hypothetical protein